MAGGGGNGEMNPWPSFVDIFASVILVLLLFMLVLMSIIAFNAQFISKIKLAGSEDSAATKDDKTTHEETPMSESIKQAMQMIEAKTSQSKNPDDAAVPVIAAETKVESNATKLYSGGQRDGSSIQADIEQKVALQEFKKNEMLIVFKDKEIFLNSDIIAEVSDAVMSLIKARPGANVTLEVSDPSEILSSSIARQISLGRIVNLKNKLTKNRELQGKIKINLEQTEGEYKFGAIRLIVK